MHFKAMGEKNQTVSAAQRTVCCFLANIVSFGIRRLVKIEESKFYGIISWVVNCVTSNIWRSFSFFALNYSHNLSNALGFWGDFQTKISPSTHLYSSLFARSI